MKSTWKSIRWRAFRDETNQNSWSGIQQIWMLLYCYVFVGLHTINTFPVSNVNRANGYMLRRCHIVACLLGLTAILSVLSHLRSSYPPCIHTPYGAAWWCKFSVGKHISWFLKVSQSVISAANSFARSAWNLREFAPNFLKFYLALRRDPSKTRLLIASLIADIMCTPGTLKFSKWILF